MKIHFPHPGYEDIEPFEAPDDPLMGVFAPMTMPDVNEEAVLREAFERPHGLPPLHTAARGPRRVLLIIDDSTRATPIDRLLTNVVDDLHRAGVDDEGIEILTAQGTHRRMTDDEIAGKLGSFTGRFKVHQHDWQDHDQLHNFGKTRDGTPVTANRLLVECDFVLGLGSIVPHRVKGFGGGAKIVFPGVAGREMMERNQWEASMQMSETVMGVADNPMRLRMEEAAAMAGLRYIVNVVFDADRRIVGCFCGDPAIAFRAGCRLSRKVHGVRMPHRADVVFIDAYPADRDLWQSFKGLYAGTMAVRDGGTLVLVAPNPEGVADNHPSVMAIGHRPHAEIVALVQSGRVEDLVGVAILADVAQIIDKTDCILVSPGVKEQEATHLGFRHAVNCQQALQMAQERQGMHASIAVLHHGGHILTLADEAAVAAHQPTA